MATFQIGSDPSPKKFATDFSLADSWVIAGDKNLGDGLDNLECQMIPGSPVTMSKTTVLESITTQAPVVSDPNNWDICTAYGYLDPVNGSDSFVRNESAPEFLYGSTYVLRGFYGHDSLKNAQGEEIISDFNFVVLNETSEILPRLGLGFPSLEYTNRDSDYNLKPDGYVYENFPLKLKNSGVIDKMMYSIYSSYSNISFFSNFTYGTLLMGSVDLEQYKGELKTFDLVNTLEDHGFTEPVDLGISVDEFIVYNSTELLFSVDLSNYSVIMQPTQVFSWLPPSIMDKFESFFPNDNRDSYHEKKINSFNITLKMGGDDYEINLSIADFRYFQLPFVSTAREDDIIYLGAGFFKNQYIAVDMEDFTVSMAELTISDKHNIIDIDESCDYSSLKKQTANKGDGDKEDSSSSSTSSSSTTSGSSDSGDSSASDGSTSSDFGFSLKVNTFFTIIASLMGFF